MNTQPNSSDHNSSIVNGFYEVPDVLQVYIKMEPDPVDCKVEADQEGFRDVENEDAAYDEQPLGLESIIVKEEVQIGPCEDDDVGPTRAERENTKDAESSMVPEPSIPWHVHEFMAAVEEHKKPKPRQKRPVCVETLVETEHKCEICSKVFSTRKSFINHSWYHKRQCVCSICGKTFSHRSRFEYHKRSHLSAEERELEEQTFSCDQCDKKFGYEDALTSHKKQVHGPKSHKCDICGYSTSLRYTLLRHLRSHSKRGEGKEDDESSGPELSNQES